MKLNIRQSFIYGTHSVTGPRTVFFTIESPWTLNLASLLPQLANLYNLTATYRRASDFANPYAVNSGLVWQPNPSFDKRADFHGQKSAARFAAALVSNCNSKRMRLLDKLREHVALDVFGKCTGKPCPLAFTNGTATADCRAILATEYMFFLAFENSVCEDYVTEKFFRTLRFDTIPVVHGGGKYDAYVSA
jgi:hypothetical protein